MASGPMMPPEMMVLMASSTVHPGSFTSCLLISSMVHESGLGGHENLQQVFTGSFIQNTSGDEPQDPDIGLEIGKRKKQIL